MVKDDSLKKAQKAHYNKIAKQYEKKIDEKSYHYYFGFTSKRIISKLQANIPKLKSKKGLDVGCGNGDLTNEVRKHCSSMIGTDLSKGMVGVAKKRYKTSNLSFTASPSDKLPFKDSEFDFCICTHLFHHLVTKELISKTMAEMKRVTKNKGIIIIVDSNKMNPIVSIGQNLMIKRGVDTGLERLVWPRTIVKLLKKNKIDVIESRGYCLIPHFLPKLIFLNDPLESTFLNKLGKDYITVGRIVK